jgi:hypothetical protein
MQQVHLPYHLFLIFTAAVVFSVVVQAAVFVGFFITARNATKKLLGIAAQLSDKAGPIVEQVGGIVRDAEPKIKTISSHVVEISTAVRDQTLHVNATVDTVVDKTNVQVGKVDEMVSAVLGGIANAGAVVQSGVLRPVRKVGGVLQGLRVGVETFFRSETPVRPTRPASPVHPVGSPFAEEFDEEMAEQGYSVTTGAPFEGDREAVHDELPPIPR